MPESGVAASEVVSPESSKRDADGKIFGVEYWKNSKSQGRASLQEEVTNIAMARKIFTLQTMRRSIFSSLTETCTLQSHCKCTIDNDDLRNLLTKLVGITLIDIDRRMH